MKVACAAIALFLASSAAAEPSARERAAVIAIDLGPGTPVYLRTTAASQVEAGLTAAGYDIVSAAEVGMHVTGELARCREGACVRRIGEALGVRSLVFVVLDGKDEHTIITLRVHDGRTGERDAEVHEICDLCGQAELADRLERAASTLRATASDTRARREQWTQVRPARPAQPTPQPTPGSTSGTGASRSLIPGLAIGTAGAIVLAAGAYLVALDGRGTCAPGDGPIYPAPGAVIRFPDPGNPDLFVCRDVYETQTLGLATAGLGAVALAAGALLVVRARRSERTLELAPRAGGAAVKVTWSW